MNTWMNRVALALVAALMAGSLAAAAAERSRRDEPEVTHKLYRDKSGRVLSKEEVEKIKAEKALDEARDKRHLEFLDRMEKGEIDFLMCMKFKNLLKLRADELEPIAAKAKEARLKANRTERSLQEAKLDWYNVLIKMLDTMAEDGVLLARYQQQPTAAQLAQAKQAAERMEATRLHFIEIHAKEPKSRKAKRQEG